MRIEDKSLKKSRIPIFWWWRSAYILEQKVKRLTIIAILGIIDSILASAIDVWGAALRLLTLAFWATRIFSTVVRDLSTVIFRRSFQFSWLFFISPEIRNSIFFGIHHNANVKEELGCLEMMSLKKIEMGAVFRERRLGIISIEKCICYWGTITEHPLLFSQIYRFQSSQNLWFFFNALIKGTKNGTIRNKSDYYTDKLT